MVKTVKTQCIASQHKIKEKKIPNLRFPGFEGEWENKRLGDLSQNIYYGMNSAAIEFDGINKYLRITDIDAESRKFVPNPLTSPNGELEDKYLLKTGDIVFARTGASVGKCYFYNDSDGKLYYAGFLIKYSIKEYTEPYFIYSYTFSSNYIKWVKVMSMRSGQPGINSEEYKSLKFFIPSLPEQKKIASFLTAVDQKIQQLTRKKELLEQYKKGVMQKIFSQEIRFKDKDGNDYPDWRTQQLGYYIEERVEFPDKSLPLYSLTIEQGMIPKNERYERSFLVKETNKAYKTMYQNDFAFNPMNLRFGALARLKENCIVSVSKYYNIFFCNKNGNPKYFEEYLTSYEMIHFYNKMATGSLEEKKRVHYLDFLKFKLRYPCIEEQNKIASFLEIIDKKIEKATNQINQTQQFKKGLLQQMFV
jgi:type I restriction enzyme S subunit